MNRVIYQYKNQVPPPPIDVTDDVQVHAEMNSMSLADSDAENTDALSQSSMDKPVVKKLLMATAEQKAIDDEMFSIDFDVPWRTASQNLHRYKINKTPESFTGGNKSSGSSVKVSCAIRKLVANALTLTTLRLIESQIDIHLPLFHFLLGIQPAKVPLTRRSIHSLIERPSTLDSPERTPSTRTFIDAGQPAAVRRSGRSTSNRWLSTKDNGNGTGRKRKSKDGYEPSDSDDDQENPCKRSSREVDSNPTMFFSATKKRNVLSTVSPESQVSDSSSSMFEALLSGPTYHKGSEIDPGKSSTPLATYGKGHSVNRTLSYGLGSDSSPCNLSDNTDDSN